MCMCTKCTLDTALAADTDRHCRHCFHCRHWQSLGSLQTCMHTLANTVFTADIVFTRYWLHCRHWQTLGSLQTCIHWQTLRSLQTLCSLDTGFTADTGRHWVHALQILSSHTADSHNRYVYPILTAMYCLL